MAWTDFFSSPAFYNMLKLAGAATQNLQFGPGSVHGRGISVGAPLMALGEIGTQKNAMDKMLSALPPDSPLGPLIQAQVAGIPIPGEAYKTVGYGPLSGPELKATAKVVGPMLYPGVPEEQVADIVKRMPPGKQEDMIHWASSARNAEAMYGLGVGRLGLATKAQENLQEDRETKNWYKEQQLQMMQERLANQQAMMDFRQRMLQSGQLTPEEADLYAEGVRQGTPLNLSGMGYGQSANLNRKAVLEALRRQQGGDAGVQNLSPEEQRQQNIETVRGAGMGRADVKALGSSLSKMEMKYNASQAAERAALAAADIIKEKMALVQPSQIPLINRAIQTGQKASGDPNVVALQNAIIEYAAEYGKIIGGSPESGAIQPEGARLQAKELINSFMSPEQIKASIDTSNRVMGARVKSWEQQANELRGKLKTGTGTVTEPNDKMVPNKNVPVAKLSAGQQSSYIEGLQRVSDGRLSKEIFIKRLQEHDFPEEAIEAAKKEVEWTEKTK